jgi:hypothetical protein
LIPSGEVIIFCAIVPDTPTATKSANSGTHITSCHEPSNALACVAQFTPSGEVITFAPTTVDGTATKRFSNGDHATAIQGRFIEAACCVQLTPSGEVITRSFAAAPVVETQTINPSGGEAANPRQPTFTGVF